MPNRIVRDAILDSPRYHGLSSDTARLLFFELLLLADDYGLTPAYPLFLSRRTAAARRATDEAITKLLAELADHDLIRVYTSGGQAYAYIPRFQNWPRAQKTKWPMPPAELGGNEIKDLQKKRSAKTVQSHSSGSADAPETETETETAQTMSAASQPRRQRKAGDQSAIDKTPSVPCPYEKIVAAYHEALPSLPRVRLMSAKRHDNLRKLWGWVLSSKKPGGERRAESADEALDWMRSYFARASENDFLMGRGARSAEHAGWQCDIDFLMTEKGMKQVIEKTEVAA